MSTHNQCFRAKIRKNVYPGKPQFYYVKVGCKGVFVTRTCFHDVIGSKQPRRDFNTSYLFFKVLDSTYFKRAKA